MTEYEVEFTVTFSVVVEAESERDATRLAEDDDWRDMVLEDRTTWENEEVSTEVYEIDEDEY